MSGTMMVFLIVAVSVFGGVLITYLLREDKMSGRFEDFADRMNNFEDEVMSSGKLKQEIKLLRERVEILERIVTDGNPDLEREFAKLKRG